MLKICLVIWKSEPQYAYRRYAYEKTCMLSLTRDNGNRFASALYSPFRGMKLGQNLNKNRKFSIKPPKSNLVSASCALRYIGNRS